MAKVAGWLGLCCRMITVDSGGGLEPEVGGWRLELSVSVGVGAPGLWECMIHQHIYFVLCRPVE